MLPLWEIRQAFEENRDNPDRLRELVIRLEDYDSPSAYELRKIIEIALQKCLFLKNKGTTINSTTKDISDSHEATLTPSISAVKPTENPAQGRLLSLIDYLSGLARVTTPTVHTLESYHNCLWLADIPRDQRHCFSRHWGTDDNIPDDVWIEVVKIKEPPLPLIPKVCEPWVDRSSLFQVSGKPSLQPSISTMSSEVDDETGERFDTVQTHQITDHPDVAAAFTAYVEQKWTPWTKLQCRYLEIQKVFATLFAIYQEQQRLGEQYELVLCTGLLSWRQPDGKPVVRRHLLVAKAALDFDAANGRFTVRAAPDGDQAELELDMLDAETFPSNADTLISSSHSLRDNFWDCTITDTLLQSVANSLEAEGRGLYDKDALRPSGVTPSFVPLVELAPALILRKRSQKGLLNLLAAMRRHVEKGGEVTQQFLELCEVSDGNQLLAESGSGEYADTPTSIFFPLPANEQQIQIIHKLNRQRGVLVQGPPGTGKSQTIANLICHLLATGQRVLVTAKTPRALEVLRDKLPVEVSPLCISMLGSGTDERESLEKSVNSILTQVNSRDDVRLAGRIAELERVIGENRRQKAETEKLILSLRERESYHHTVADNAYSGTAASIAERIRAEEGTFSWFQDVVAENDGCPLSTQEISQLKELVASIDHSTENELGKDLPLVGVDVPEPGYLSGLMSKTSNLRAALAEGDRRLRTQDGISLTAASVTLVNNLLTQLDCLIATYGSVLNRPFSWIAKAAREVLNDIDTPWKELRRLTSSRLQILKPLVDTVQAYSIDVPSDVDRRRLAIDARALQSHYTAGRGLKRLLFFDDPIVKQHCTTLALCYVNGAPCLLPDSLNKLCDYLSAEQGIAEIWSYWQGKTDHQPGHHLVIELAHIEEHLDALDYCLNLYNSREAAIKAVDAITGLARPHWGEISILIDLAQTCRDVLAKADLMDAEAEFARAEVQVAAVATKVNAHQLCTELLLALRAGDADAYFRITGTILSLSKSVERLKTKNGFLQRLRAKAPRFSGFLQQNEDIGASIGRISQLEKAWAWRRAIAWLENLDSKDGATLERNVKRLEEIILTDVGKLASLKAWTHCFSRMTRAHQQHLETWQQAMRRLGKGTGIHAHKHRQDAQRHLTECKTAVPAWIMPLHRVYETVDGSPGCFDIIIIDEASQAGYEALPLLYLGRKIIVVGDEKQISPEVVGVNLNLVNNLMRAHLHSFAMRDSFSIDNSLFAHGRIRFGNRITLQEHFRCAPEIIRFSNDLCYTSAPLIPLKQCPPNRLKPLIAEYVPSGYREGNASSAVNLPEAEVLVQRVKECVDDRRYDGMSMGVIVLQGDAQAKVIENLLVKAVGTEEMQERKLLCGNPYSFQGDERDVIFLSMVAAKGETKIGAMVKEADMRRFNVAASRAREQMWLFHSVTDNDLSKDCVRRRLLRHFTDTHETRIVGIDVDQLRRAAFAADRYIERPPIPFDSWFEVDVALDIAGKGYTVVPQFEFAGKRIDLVIQGGSAQFAVECDGDHWHGIDAAEDDLRRQRMLERCNWVFYRVRESAYRINAGKALAALWPLLEERGIFPGNNDPETGAEPDGSRSDSGSASKDQDRDEVHEEPEEDTDAEDEQGDAGSDKFSSKCLIQGCPGSLEELLALKPSNLRRLIISVIKAKSGQTCIRSKVTALILQVCHIRTHGTPRRQFQKKVEAQIAVMVRDGGLVAYRSKNERLRLGWKTLKELESMSTQLELSI